MSGFGLKSFGLSPYGTPTVDDESSSLPDLSSSKNYNGKTRDYQIAADGGFSYMDDVYQRVILLVAFGTQHIPPLRSADFGSKIDSSIRNALKPLTTGKPPAIRLKRVTVSDDGKTTAFVQVEFFRVATATYEIVKQPLV